MESINVTIKATEEHMDEDEKCETLEATNFTQVFHEVRQGGTSATLQDKFPNSSDDEFSQDLNEKQSSQEAHNTPILQCSSRIQKNHPTTSIIAGPHDVRRTKDKTALIYHDMVNHSYSISCTESN